MTDPVGRPQFSSQFLGDDVHLVHIGHFGFDARGQALHAQETLGLLHVHIGPLGVVFVHARMKHTGDFKAFDFRNLGTHGSRPSTNGVDQMNGIPGIQAQLSGKLIADNNARLGGNRGFVLWFGTPLRQRFHDRHFQKA